MRSLAFVSLTLLVLPAAAFAQDAGVDGGLDGGTGAGLVWLDEVSPGRSADPDAEYVVLRFDEAATGSWRLEVDDGLAAPAVWAEVSGSAARGVLVVATDAAASFYGIDPDVIAPEAGLPDGGTGRVCLWEGTTELDCVGWGGIADNAYGTPVGTLPADQVLSRLNYGGQNSTDWVVASDPDPAASLALEGGLTGGDGGEDGGSDGGTDGGEADDGGTPGTPGPPTEGGDVPDRSRGCATAGAGGTAMGLLLLGLAAWRLRSGTPSRSPRT